MTVSVIGLTGQSGAGKTTVSEFFEKNGYEVINCDLVARQVTEKDTVCLAQIAHAFGSAVLLEDGSLNRKALAAIVFSDKEKLQLLDDIIFPYITQKIVEIIDTLNLQGTAKILLDAPTLFESGADSLCNKTVGVVADTHIRQQRIMERDGLTQQEAQDRMNSQLNEQYFKAHCDFVIENNNDLIQMEQALERLLPQL